MSDPYVDTNTHKLVVTFISSIQKDGEIKAVVGGDLPVDNLIKSVLTVALPADGYAFLVNSHGAIIAYPDAALTLKSMAEAIPSLTVGYLSAQMA